MKFKEKYEYALDCYNSMIKNGINIPAMLEMYKESIEKEFYANAKALTEILAKYGVRTKDTHPFIKSLNEQTA